jgi:hypothetical protein
MSQLNLPRDVSRWKPSPITVLAASTRNTGNVVRRGVNVLVTKRGRMELSAPITGGMGTR